MLKQPCLSTEDWIHRADVVAEALECLPSKHEALSSSPSTERKGEKRMHTQAGCQWLLAPQEAEIRRISVQSQLG
jgi:hypothetical protein